MPDELHTIYFRLLRALRRLRPEERLCPIYETRDEQLMEALAFVQVGLEQGERCLYVTDEKTATSMRGVAQRLGFDLDRVRREGALLLCDTTETPSPDEDLDPTEMFSFLAGAIEEAENDGYGGFRWIADMTWQLGKNPGKRALIEYVARLDAFFSEHKISALCQYDRRSLSPDVILEAVRIHPVLICGLQLCRNPHYIPPQELLKPPSADRELERHLDYLLHREQSTAQLTYQAKLLEHISDAVLSFDSRFVMTSWNKAAERLYGWKPEEVLGRPLKEILNPEFIGMAREEAVTFLLKNGHLEAEAIQHRKDGQPLRVEIRNMALHNELGETTGYVCIHRDVTESRRAEEELRQSQRRFQDLVETISDWVWEVDARGVYTYAGPRVYDLLGYTPQEVLGKTPFDLMPEGDAQNVAEIFKKLVEKQEPFSGLENTNRHKDGHLVVLETSGIPFFDKSGNLLGYRGVDRDITERKKAEEALQASSRMKTEFVSTTAHEFRTPLTSIQGYSELLLTHQDLPSEERREFLSYIHESSAELSRIVADLLDIARIEEGHGLSLNLSPCPVKEMFEKITPFLKTKALGRRIDVSLEKEEDCLIIDKGKMGQVLENLLSNALKYSPEGSLVRIRGEEGPMCYQVSVSDQGIGMTPKQVEKIFDKFFRADTSHTAVSGIGLGMSIVKYIIDAHGGEIWVESERGRGTTVTFTLPNPSGKKKKDRARLLSSLWSLPGPL